MVAANIFQWIVGVLPLLVIVTAIASKNPVNIILLPLPLIALSMVCAGVGFLVSALYVFFRDLPYFYELFCFVLWISSPIFYPSDIVPPSVKSFLVLNPLMPIIESIRQITLSESLPEFMPIAHALINGLLVLTIGWLCFRSWQERFMDLL